MTTTDYVGQTCTVSVPIHRQSRPLISAIEAVATQGLEETCRRVGCTATNITLAEIKPWAEMPGMDIYRYEATAAAIDPTPTPAGCGR